MSIGGEKGNVVGSKLRVGAATGAVLIFNPTNDEMKEKLGFTSNRVVEYKSVDNGVRKLRLDVWLSETETGRKHCCTFRLKDVESKNPEGKVRYINKQGHSTFWKAPNESLPDWFASVDYWIAREGEYELYRFLKAFTKDLDKKEYTNVNRRLNWERLLNGNVTELNDVLKEDFVNNVLYGLTVRMGKVEGGFKPFQSVYNRDFLPADMIRYVDNPGLEANKYFISFVEQFTHEKHGCKEFFDPNRKFVRAHDYDPAQHAMASDAPLIVGGPVPASALPVAAATENIDDLLDDEIFADLEDDDDLNTDY